MGFDPGGSQTAALLQSGSPARHYNDSFKGGFHGQSKKKQNSNLRFSLSFCIAVFSHYYLTNLYVRIL